MKKKPKKQVTVITAKTPQIIRGKVRWWNDKYRVVLCNENRTPMPRKIVKDIEKVFSDFQLQVSVIDLNIVSKLSETIRSRNRAIVCGDPIRPEDRLEIDNENQ